MLRVLNSLGQFYYFMAISVLVILYPAVYMEARTAGWMPDCPWNGRGSCAFRASSIKCKPAAEVDAFSA